MEKNNDYIGGIAGAERRFAVAGMTVEKRAAGEGDAEAFVVQGYAALFNSPTEICGWFREVILPGAFDDCLDQDVRCLFNHNPNYILARSGGESPTLEYGVDNKGLWYRYTTPDRTYARDLANAIESGDVSQSSFAFKPKEVVWREISDDKDLREIVKIETLFDVSPVTYPAYADTTVGKRSLDAYKQEKDAQLRTEDNGLSLHAAQIFINENNHKA
jgi:HK97 family phage prohead protease